MDLDIHNESLGFESGWLEGISLVWSEKEPLTFNRYTRNPFVTVNVITIIRFSKHDQTTAGLWKSRECFVWICTKR
jgi:hypothetical protein